MLGWLAFLFSDVAGGGYVGEVDVEGVFCSDVVFELAGGLDVEFVFYVADGAAYFEEDDVRSFLFCDALPPVLDGVGHVGDELDGFAEVVSFSFFFADGGEDFSHGEVPGALARDAEESFVVAKVHVDFAAVVENEDFSVFDGVHRSRVDVEVPVAFHGDDAVVGGEKVADARRRDSFA